MIAATRITRRILRKLVKPVALWWNAQLLAKCEDRANHFCLMRAVSIPMERAERERQVALTAKRRQIENW